MTFLIAINYQWYCHFSLKAEGTGHNMWWFSLSDKHYWWYRAVTIKASHSLWSGTVQGPLQLQVIYFHIYFHTTLWHRDGDCLHFTERKLRHREVEKLVRDCKVVSKRAGVHIPAAGFRSCVLNHHMTLFSAPLGVGPFGLVKALCPTLVHFEKVSS